MTDENELNPETINPFASDLDFIDMLPKDWGKPASQFKHPMSRHEMDELKEALQKNDENEEARQETQTVQLIKYVTENPDITLFHNEQKEMYVRLPIDTHFEVWPCESSSFKRWLAKSFYESTGKVPAQNVLAGALQVIQAMADFNGDEVPLATRSTLQGNEIWYDLADKDWQVVRITSEGWQIESIIPPIFKRYGYQAPQVGPVLGGDIRDILRFVNITNPEHQMLFLVGLCAYFISGSPRPIFYFYGPQGSAKTTASKILRKLIDPSRVEILSLPKNIEEAKQMLAHYYFLSFDNVSRIYDDTSDLLCQAVTGSGFSKRKLYTDDDDIIRTVQANISINGINIATTKPDFLERCVLIELNRVAKTERKQEHELMSEFESLQPMLLGAIFSAISRALTIKPTIKSENLPRMADFAVWGAAIAEAIGYSREDFMVAYRRNINTQNEEVLSDNPTAMLVLMLMGEREEWHGTASNLLSELRSLAETNHINHKDLPGSPQALSRELSSLKTSLEEAELFISKTAGNQRTITITKVSAGTVDSVIESVADVEQDYATDDIFGDSLTGEPWHPEA